MKLKTREFMATGLAVSTLAAGCGEKPAEEPPTYRQVLASRLYDHASTRQPFDTEGINLKHLGKLDHGPLTKAFTRGIRILNASPPEARTAVDRLRNTTIFDCAAVAISHAAGLSQNDFESAVGDLKLAEGKLWQMERKKNSDGLLDAEEYLEEADATCTNIIFPYEGPVTIPAGLEK